MKINALTCIIISIFVLNLTPESIRALELLNEDFESPSTPTSWSKGVLPDNGKWVGSTIGFGATDIGITDKASGDFSALDPNHQAFAFRKTNQSGITTAEGVLHKLFDGVTITVQFDAVWDEGDAANAFDYNAELIAYAPDAHRNEVRILPSGSLKLATKTGSCPTDGTFETVSFSVTGDAVTHAGYIGYDVGLRFIGSYSSSLIDNVIVTSDIDTTPPGLSTLSPADDSTGVALDTDFVIEFDEDIVADSGNVIISNVTEGTATTIDITNSAQVSISGSTLTINPTSDLEPGDDYAILIDATALKDVYITYYGGISDATTWNFTANNSDTIAPSLLSVNPTTGTLAIAPSANLVASFTEPVQPANGGTITLTNITAGNATTINLLDGQVTADGADITINPTTDLAQNSIYAVLMDGSAIQDVALNHYAGISDTNTWQFRTAGPPTVTLNGGASDLGVGAATLNGIVTVGDVADVYFCWGTVDGGTSTGAWENVISMGSNNEDAAFSSLLSGLYYGIEYKYAVYAENSYGSDWSDVDSFKTAYPAAEWLPTDVISPVAWFDAADSDTITQSGGLVSEWQDKSGNGNHATQASSANQPTYLASDPMINDYPSIGNINGGSKIGLDTPSFGAKTIYAVTYYKDGIDSSFDDYSTLFSGPGANGLYRVMGTVNSANFIGTSLFNDVGTYKNGSTISTLNGVLPMGASLFKFKSSATRTQAYSLGYNTQSTTRDWAGFYSEFIFTDGSEDSATEEMIEGYLAWKWGLEGNLPGGHQYALAAPGGDGTLPGVSNSVAINVGETTADLTGIVDAPVSVFDVYAYYGPNSNTTANAWTTDPAATNVYVGAYTNVTGQVLSVSIDSLTGDTSYFYSMMATNAATNLWALPAAQFDTLVGDDVPPVLEAQNPADGASGVAVDAILTATFDEAVVLQDGGTITVTNLTEATGMVITLPDGQVSVSSTSNVVINPSFNLDEADDYAILIDGVAIEDVFGNVYAGISDTTTWNFTVEAVPPTIASTDFVDDASGGPVYMDETVTYTVTFNEDMDASTVSADDFANAGTAPILIGSVTETSTGVFSVEVTATNTGTLVLSLKADATVNDFFGVPWMTGAAVEDDTTITVNYIRTVLTEDFEVPDTPTAYSQGTTPSGWVRSSVGYRPDYHGITDKAGGDFTAPDPNHQAYAFRYGGDQGITSSEGRIGKLFAGVTYRVSFDIVEDGADTDGFGYDAALLVFDEGAARTDVSPIEQDATPLQIVVGNGPTDGSFETITFTYTADAVADADKVGKDLAIRFKGDYTSGLIDNVVVQDTMEVTAPRISTLSPADDGTGVALDADFVITFDEDVVADSGNVIISNVTEGTVTTINITDGSQISISGAVLTINPGVNLETGDSYAILIDTNAIKDVYITHFDGITDPTVWNFVADATDAIAPTLISVHPANGTFAVNPAGNLVATFSEDVVPASGGTITLTNITEGTARVINLTDGQVTASGSQITINPSADLELGDNYAVLIDGNAIEDLAGNKYAGISDTNIWNLVMAGAPTVGSADIVDNQSGSDIYAYDSVVYTVTFSQDMDDSTVTAADFANGGTAAITVESVAETSAGVFTVEVLATSEGTLQLEIAAGASLQDIYGFAMDTSAAVQDDTTITVHFARLLLTEDFEVPDTPIAYSSGTTPAGWVRNTTGIYADRHGITDKVGGDFSAPDPNHQAYAFRYTGNQCITTEEGAIGTLFPGVTYLISFDVIEDGGKADADDTGYDVALMVFDDGAARNDIFNSSIDNGGTLLHYATGNGPADGSFGRYTFSYTAERVADASELGKDVALRIKGDGAAALIDNVMVRDTYQTPPSIFRFR